MRRTLSFLFAICFAGGLLLFLSTLCGHIPPGTFAFAVASHLGVVPFAPVDSPLWGIWIGLTRPFLMSGSFSLLNAGNAVLAALATALTAWLCASIPHDRNHEEKRSQLDPSRAAFFSGVVAALVLATTPAFWFAATRACPDMLGVALLLAACLIWLRSLGRDRVGALFVGCLVLGIGCVENATFFLALPLFVLVVLASSLRRRRVRWTRVLACLFFFLAGYAVILHAAAVVWRSPSASWRGFETYWDCLWAVFRQQKVLLVQSIPRVGWLLLGLLSFLPLLVVVVPKERLQKSSRWPSYALHLALTGLAGLMLFNSWVSIYSQFKFSVLTLAPCVINAIWIGYLAGYWWCVFHSRSRMEMGPSRLGKALGARIWPIVCAGILGWVGMLNFRLVDPRHTDWTDGYADYLLECLPEDGLLVTESPVDSVVALKAWRAGRAVRLLSPLHASSANYLGYMGTLWKEPRLRSLAQVGALPVLSEWIRVQPAQATAQLRSDYYDAPAYAAGWEAVPSAPFYVPASSLDGVDADALAARLADWAGRPFMKNALEDKHVPDAYRGQREWLRVTSSKFANNLGVLAERVGRPELAERQYRQARAWNPDNPSALLNLSELARRQPPADARAIQQDVETLISGLKGKFALFSLNQRHGLIAKAEAFVERGFAWAVSGRPTLGSGEIRRAIQLSQHDDHLRLMLAFLQFEDAASGSGEPELQAILARDPANATALAQLARVQASRGDLESARASLDRAMESQPKSPTLKLQKVGLEILADNLPGGLDLLKTLTREDSGNLQAWALLALLAHQAGQDDLVTRAEEHLSKREDLNTSIRLVLADLQRRRKNLGAARTLLENALRRDRGNPLVHDQLLRVLYLDRDRHRAREVVRDLLRLDPNHSFANLIQGSIQFEDGDLEFAEASFQASVRAQPSAEALNSLAFILAQKGRHSEGLPLAEQADALQPGDPSVLDTLAVIHFGLSRLDPALEYARKAVLLATEDAEIALHLAQILDARGERKEALTICNDLFNRIGQVPPRLQTTLTDLRARLERSLAGGS